MTTRIASTAKVYSHVELADDVVVEDFTVIGCIPAGGLDKPRTVIGPGSVIRSGTVVYGGTRIGRGFQTGNKANIRESNDIGDWVSVGTLSVVEHHVTIGNGVRLHSQVFIPEFTILEDDCWLGPNVVITNDRYPKSPGNKDRLEGVRIGKGGKIGANATLLPGVQIGEEALVGAGSVVTRDVEAYSVVVGNPAVRIKWIKELPVYSSEGRDPGS